MKHPGAWRAGSLAVIAIVLSPIVVVLAVPLAIGLGLDLCDLVGETPVALVLCAPPAVMLLRRLSGVASLGHLVGRLRLRLHLGRPAGGSGAPYAP
jgi:hypothetical protein